MSDFDKFLKKGSKGHLIGIGGVSMSPLAEVLHDAGLEITGSDIAESERTSNLRGKGIEIFIGHDAANITPDTQFVVRTAAAHDDNPEVIRAHEMGIPVFERTQAWGAIMKGYKNALCISGTHGKTTTTSMCTHILMAAEKDPTVMIGGTLPLLQAGHRVGNGDTIIMESCEYYNSFLQFYPTVAVILNIESDHLDFFSGIEYIKKSFRAFAENVPHDGYVVANYDDENTMDALKGIDRNVVTFGLTSKADVYAKNVVRIGSLTKFDIMYKGKYLETANIHVPGEHNLKNALAAAAAFLKIIVRKERAVIPECAEVGGRDTACLEIVVAHEAVGRRVKAHAEKVVVQGLDLGLVCADGGLYDLAVMGLDGVGKFLVPVLSL